MLYYSSNLAFLWTFGLLLAIKAYKKRFENVIYFGIAIITNGFLFAIKLAYTAMEIDAGKVIIPEIPFILSLIPGIIFVKKTFHGNKNSPVVAVVWVVYMVAAAIAIVAGILEELSPDAAQFKVARYFVDDLVLYPLLFTWNIVNGIKAYLNTATTASRFVRLRFIYFALGHVAGIVSGVLDYLSGIVSPIFYGLYAPVSVACAVVYGLFMYLTWFPPAALFRGKAGDAWALAVNERCSDGNLQGVGVSPGNAFPVQQLENARVQGSSAGLLQKMLLIERFGKILSHNIGRSPAACSGLLLTCIEDRLGNGSVFRMGIGDLQSILASDLPSRLDALGIANVKEAVTALKDDLAANLSYLTMSMF